MPKILRRYFLYDRKLLVGLSRCAWKSLKVFLYPEGHKQERMQYLDQEGKVVYASKAGKSIKVFPAMEWLAATRALQGMCSHIPIP